MTGTIKHKKTNKNVTKKNLKCPIGLKSFEEGFSKNISQSQLKKSSKVKKHAHFQKNNQR